MLRLSRIEVLNQLREVDVEFDAAPHKRDLTGETQPSDCIV
jgi:hypothetical protein